MGTNIKCECGKDITLPPEFNLMPLEDVWEIINAEKLRARLTASESRVKELEKILEGVRPILAHIASDDGKCHCDICEALTKKERDSK